MDFVCTDWLWRLWSCCWGVIGCNMCSGQIHNSRYDISLCLFGWNCEKLWLMWRVIMLSTEEKITGALSSGVMGLSIDLSVGCYNMASIWCEWPFSINDLFQGILVKFMVPISFLTLNVLSKLNLFWIWVRYSLYIYIFRIKYKIKKFIILKHFIQTSWITSFPHINLYINTCISI